MKVERIWFQTRLRLTQGKVRVRNKLDERVPKGDRVKFDEIKSEKDARILRYKADT